MLKASSFVLADGFEEALTDYFRGVYRTAERKGKAFVEDLMKANPGLASRIGREIHFDDYSTDELTQIFIDKLYKAGFMVSEDARQRAGEIMEYFQRVKNFENGRFVNHVIHQTINRRAERDFARLYRDITAQDTPTIKELIENYAMTSFGTTVGEIIQTADRISMDIIEARKQQLQAVADMLLAEKQITGAEFVKMLEEQK